MICHIFSNKIYHQIFNAIDIGQYIDTATSWSVEKLVTAEAVSYTMPNQPVVQLTIIDFDNLVPVPVHKRWASFRKV
jgi:hypothetical protein